MVRPKKYTPERVAEFLKYIEQGCTDKQAGENVDISHETTSKWKKKPEFLAAYKKAKEESINKVENMLFKSAEGYHVIETTKITKVIDGKKYVETKEHKKYISPSVTAQIFILKNKREEVWRDRQDTKLEGSLSVGAVIKVNEIDIEKVKKEKAKDE